MEKMNINSITIYANKNGRSNSKWISKQWKKFDDAKFTLDDIYFMIEWVASQEYRYSYSINVWDNENCTIPISAPMTIEQIINYLYYYTRYLNMKEHEFTLAELHNDPNIRYLINQYYGGVK